MVKVDVDPGDKPYGLRHVRTLLARAGYALVSRSKVRSGSGKGWHVYLTIEPPASSPMELIALQAVLGSDRYREACNIARARVLPKVDPFWRERFNVLYDGRGLCPKP